MIKGISFQTKARTVDHLGREQIADTPTAVSELWKNAYDAYARHAELNIYDGDPPIATIVDDGHGMNRDEFISRWLVVGTAFKAAIDKTPLRDRNGLRARPRQGQKGIGRLSCANLGSILLFVSKRENDDFVAALVDWRLFENPFLNLADIELPVTEFSTKVELLAQVPGLVDELLQNVIGGPDHARSTRIKEAWASFDAMHVEEVRDGTSNRDQLPSEELLTSIKRLNFQERHLEQWSVWTDDSSHGTALLIAEINHDLRVQLQNEILDTSDERTKKRFFETLSGFVDPFRDPSSVEVNATDPQFSNAVRVWHNDKSVLILGTEKQFSLKDLQPMEHQIFGFMDEKGIFRGRVKAFGQWVQEECVIEPPRNLNIPDRTDSKTGPFDIYIGAIEFDQNNTTHSKEEFQHFLDLAERYAGFMVYRDGLRVLPFGREDNDFFEIESRRSRSAGREFWNKRQMFGRIAISRARNPNLKDKAGREGIIDNRAAKTLRELVSHVLMLSARRYFGSSSEYRKTLLPNIRKTNNAQRFEEAQRKQREKERRSFRIRLNKLASEIDLFLREISIFCTTLKIETEADLANAQSALDNFKIRAVHFRLEKPDGSLGTLQDKFASYRNQTRTMLATIDSISETVNHGLEAIRPVDPGKSLEERYKMIAQQMRDRLGSWKEKVRELQRNEFQRINTLSSDRDKLFSDEAKPLIHRFNTQELNYVEATKLLEGLRDMLDAENADMFESYIGALESLSESIDLEHLARFGMEQLSELRSELERLNSLAQLGIAVEIVGHELQSYDEIIGSGLRRLPDEVRASKAAKDIEFGYEGLTDQLRFLSPLRLAGQKIQRWITGEEIFGYINDFFKITLANNNITFGASNTFKNIRVFDQQSRLYPVFINLVNNAIYWLSVGENKNRRILFDVHGSEVVISDNGPGIEAEDLDSLFTLFFTKKVRGGRGVGLYLSRANLTAGGHKIRYEPDTTGLPLPGANFLIEFRGAEFDGE
ncbi:sensor histidine kinase [Hoeflea sp. AS60]|uniref:sensor histidine kinase n=1 Tax=Hoeflea sp. AS60 TaxID=3135780 RepID=UPI003179B4AA